MDLVFDERPEDFEHDRTRLLWVCPSHQRPVALAAQGEAQPLLDALHDALEQGQAQVNDCAVASAAPWRLLKRFLSATGQDVDVYGAHLSEGGSWYHLALRPACLSQGRALGLNLYVHDATLALGLARAVCCGEMWGDTPPPQASVVAQAAQPGDLQPIDLKA